MQWIHTDTSTAHSAPTGAFESIQLYYMWAFEKAMSYIEQSQVAIVAGNIGPQIWGPYSWLVHGFYGRGSSRSGGKSSSCTVGTEPPDTMQTQMNRRAGISTSPAPCWTTKTPMANSRHRVGQGSWNTCSAQAHAILILSRSTGGGCIDTDGDGVCDDEDNCVLNPNPIKWTDDGDGLVMRATTVRRPKP